MSVAVTKRRASVKPDVPKSKPVERPKPLSGLCTTCNRAKGCSYLRNPGQPVLFCEEFDSFTPPVIEEVAAEDNRPPTIQEMNDWEKYKGLCVNCDSREDCTIRNQEIGVWHCEEYR